MSPAEPQIVSGVLTDPNRLLRIAETGLFDSAAEEGFDKLAKLAAKLLGAPTALVSLVDDRRQYFKACVGLSEPVASSRETPLSHSFCKTVVVTNEPLVVENALTDSRVVGNLAIRDLGVMAYLGIPIHLPTGEVIGSLCVIDDKPRPWSVSDVSILEDLALAVESEIALRLKAKQLNELVNEAEIREDELRVSKRAIEAVNVGVTISDATEADMPLVYCNAAFERMTGYSSTESIGRNCRFLQGSDTDQETLQELRDGLSAKSDGLYVLKNYRADGSVFWNELRISPVTDPSGSLTHFVGVQTDITERLNSEAALVEANRLVEVASDAKSQFIANMSHELRTPLSAIIGYAELLDEEAADLGDSAALLRSDIGKVHSAAHHLLNLINGVLDIAKIEAGKMEIELEEFALIDLTQEVVETVSTLVREKNNTLTVEISPDIGCMLSDRMRIKQCLINLMSNAAKFTKGGEITLRIVEEDGDIRFRVSDTGVGMSNAQVAKLFNRFSQADASTTRQFGGTGLGLALTKEFASLLGGEISVQSAEGKGTTFELTLPIRAKILAHATEVQTDPLPFANRTRGPNIVVIDDDPLQQDLIGRFLSRHGFTVAFAADGIEGLRLSKQLRPSVILLDVHMPLMNGWSVLTALKDSPQTSSIPVIMITVEHERTRGLALGADDYLTKPVDWKRLHRALINHIPPGAERSAWLLEGEHSSNHDLEACLASQGWEVRSVRSKAEASNLIETQNASLYVVDLQQTGADGLDFISELQNLPGNEKKTIIALTSGDAEAVSTSKKGFELLLDSSVVSNALIDEIQRCITARVKRDD